MHCPPGDDSQLKLQLHPRELKTFDGVPKSLSNNTYYVPLSSNFAAVDALTKEMGIQYTVAEAHPIKGPQVLKQLAPLYPGKKLVFLFVVPESLAAGFEKQPILTVAGTLAKQLPLVRQYVAGLPLGISTRQLHAML